MSPAVLQPDTTACSANLFVYSPIQYVLFLLLLLLFFAVFSVPFFPHIGFDCVVPEIVKKN
jgi:hypothetical protein